MEKSGGFSGLSGVNLKSAIFQLFQFSFVGAVTAWIDRLALV
jgi:hypothetical protein